MLQLVALMLLPQQALHPVAHGVASYYTVTSSSEVTASGDTLDDSLFTCALPRGEFGSQYLIVAENGRSVVCTLNDRGPYIKNRVVDLSKAAMRALHGTAGTLRVKVYKMDPGGVPDLLRPSQKKNGPDSRR